MDFAELEAFVVLARTLHFARASGQLHMSPSALSRLVGRLEDELGVRLLERDTRRVTLSDQGTVFLDWAQETLARQERLHADLLGGEGTLRGSLRIYASVTACYSILPPLVSILQRDHPQLRLGVDTGDPADALDRLQEGRADLALAFLPAGGTSPWARFSVTWSPLVLVAAGEGPHRDAMGAGRRLALEDLPLVVPSHGPVRELLDHWLQDQGKRASIRAEVSGNEAILALARLGLGVGLVPQIVLENSPFQQGLVIRPVDQELGSSSIGFVIRSNAPWLNKIKSVLAAAYPQGSWVDAP